MPSSTNPLHLNKTKSDADIPASLPRGLRTTINALSCIRFVTAASCFLAPVTTCGLINFPIAPAVGILVRMNGVKDALFGELLFTATVER
jgi:hypothetical protein